MKIGDLVEIGWDGRAAKPFIGVVVEMLHTAGGQTGYVMVNGETHYADLGKLRKVNDSTRRSSAARIQSRSLHSDIKE